MAIEPKQQALATISTAARVTCEDAVATGGAVSESVTAAGRGKAQW
jgi:hypothetical protein